MMTFLSIPRSGISFSTRNFHVSALNLADEFSRRSKSAGYESESHKVKTKDGYILTLHRLLPKPQPAFKGSAFLMHGLYRNSTDFIAAGPNKSLAYLLSDNGYNVWLGNARGSTYSREHVKLKVESKEFWKFSFHEIGLYDVSAMLNFMLDHSKESKTFYVGHSQGSSSLLALLSTSPKYNQKIIEGHLLAPAVFMQHATSPAFTIPAKRPELVTVNIDKKNLQQSLELTLSMFAEVCKSFQ